MKSEELTLELEEFGTLRSHFSIILKKIIVITRGDKGAVAINDQEIVALSGAHALGRW